jgi:hypothetical protein
MAETSERRHWAAHRWRARLLRLLVYAVPIAGSVAFVRVTTALTGVPTGSLAVFLLWWLALSAGATAVVSGIYALSRRLLPLGALLGLSLIFPDEAPSRFLLALRTRTVESLEARLRQLREDGGEASTQQAAEILIQLAAALDDHDRLTRGHAERVRAYSSLLGKQIGLGGDDLDRLNWAALLHDIGKLRVAREILNSPGRPTDEQWESLRRHPLYGEELAAPLRQWLGSWWDAIGYHHERWDGEGYTRGLAGEDIPLAGRIVAIADVFDVITSTRSYKQASGTAAGRAEIARCAGSQFDPRLVRAFLNISLGKMRLVMGPLSWLSDAPLLARLPLTPSVGAAFGGLATLVTAVAAGGFGSPATAAAAPASRPHPVRQPTATTPPARPRRIHAPPTPSVKTISPSGNPAPSSPSAPPAASPAAQPPSGETTSPPSAPQQTPPTSPSGQPPAPQPPPPAPQPPPPAPQPPPPAPQPPPPAPQPPPPPPPPPVNHPPSFTAGGDQSVLEDAGAQSLPGWATNISAGPTNESSQTVAFTATADQPALFSTQPAVAAGGTLSYTPAPNANGTATVTVKAVDDGGTANGGNNSSPPQTFTITIQPVNDPPSFTAGGDQSVLEDAGAQSLPGWATNISAGPTNESSQTVAFTATADQPALFSTQPAVAADGTLSYTPAPNANGTATVTVTAKDDGGTANGGNNSSPPQTFTITIQPVNDPPSFTAGANQTALIGLLPQTVPGWASSISPGPADESGQQVHFVVTVDNPSLFSVQPAVAPDGTLTYTPTLALLGTATVTVKAVDDGGTANGGNDTSPPQTFTITIIL